MSPVANFTRVNLDQLFLPFVQQILKAIAACNERGAHYFATLGTRTFEQQAKLYFQGRTMPGPKVTDAGPGESAHNYGLAVDFARLEGKQYLKRAADYAILGEEAERVGLVWGGRFHKPDADHVQLAGYVTGAELMPLKSIYLANPGSPLSAVFSHLSKGVQK